MFQISKVLFSIYFLDFGGCWGWSCFQVVELGRTASNWSLPPMHATPYIEGWWWWWWWWWWWMWMWWWWWWWPQWWGEWKCLNRLHSTDAQHQANVFRFNPPFSLVCYPDIVLFPRAINDDEALKYWSPPCSPALKSVLRHWTGKLAFTTPTLTSTSITITIIITNIATNQNCISHSLIRDKSLSGKYWFNTVNIHRTVP